MKRFVISMIALFLGIVTFAQVLTPVSKSNVQGSWYGLYCGSPASVSFNADGTYQIWSESFSQMNMSGSYSLDGNTLSLGGIPGMDGKGLVALKGEEIDLLFVFGAQGMVQAPKSFEEGAGNPAATRLHLSRDQSAMNNATVKVTAPEAAKLAFERNRLLGKGINLNAVLDGLSGDKPLMPGALRDIAKQGFTSVRIPIRWGDHTSNTAPYTIDPAFLKNVDDVVEECISAGLVVTLDNHYYPGISFGFAPQDLSYEDNITRLNCIWEQLSIHYAYYSDEKVFFEIMNEPSLQLDPARWNEIVAGCVKSIRKHNPGRTILVTTPSLGQHWTIGLLEFPEDEWNIIVDAHYYLPQTFTHQGLSYAMAEGSLGMKWTGSEMEKTPILMDMDFLARWSERSGRPVNIGEYGVCANADDDSRNAYLGYICNEIAGHGFSSNIWTYHRDTFGLYDEEKGQWNQGLLNALKLK